MTTFIDAAGRTRQAERRSAARRRVDDPAEVVRPRDGEKRLVGEGAAQPAAARVRARRSGEWLWLTSVAIFTFLIVMLVGLFGVRDAPMTGGTALVEVRPGDTLWGIADRVAPNSDPREVVTRIAELNGLDAASVPTGRLLLVPVPG
ncbi:LysM domain-containing protein [Saccharopolyspora antimicrobica]|uniref:LysM domain-containing protein n=1 Tax=Saccharopolyspora antimicrobica TaxID=455193 RepID=A0A1I5HQR6_9PSEU|nr:LysM peptidoglycan-binding domain-containing protein [Saccharopolyspora antimicrobica]RKT82401.1 LysM domain-containing protein [Saccharopolyspora antimicrobica]SFO50161.1 LysM domain-containing protein [Saccharopolyspora antimicrobica]